MKSTKTFITPASHGYTWRVVDYYGVLLGKGRAPTIHKARAEARQSKQGVAK